MYMHDVGLTFGRATKLNQNSIGSMNLVEWSGTPVWKDTAGCVGNLPKSVTGTLFDPPISEQGRQFLADLLVQLSDDQLRGMFEAARVTCAFAIQQISRQASPRSTNGSPRSRPSATRSSAAAARRLRRITQKESSRFTDRIGPRGGAWP